MKNDAEETVWVMTRTPKWAFGTKADAERSSWKQRRRQNAFTGMYEDTMTIRENR